MHPLDTLDRRELVKDEFKIGMCNITKCCSEVCPESIRITDNAIIPLKERVADDFYDPVRWLMKKIKPDLGSPKATPAGRRSDDPSLASERRRRRRRS
jgi:hypothetical protein